MAVAAAAADPAAARGPVQAAALASATAALTDPNTWVGAAVGAVAVLGVVFALWRLGRLRWVVLDERRRVVADAMSAVVSRRISSYSIDGETWYDALEEHFPTTAGFVEYAGCVASQAVPLLWGDGDELDPGLPSMTPGSRPRLRQLKGRSVPKIAPGDAVVIGAAAWSPGDASELRVRRGPDYRRQGAKEASMPAMYTCAGADIVCAGCRLDEVVPRLGPLPPGGVGWRRELGVPRVLVVNCQMPFVEGPKLFGQHPADDAGVSVVGQWTASADLLRVAAMEAGVPCEGLADLDALTIEAYLPAVRLWRRFVERGSLELRPGEKGGAHSSCTLKCIGMVDDLDGVELPRLLRPSVERYNGKPVLLTGLGTLHADPSGEWLEVDVDIRKFSWPTRSMLCKLRDKMREVSIHMAWVIQGTEDDELPEVVLASMRLHTADLDRGAWIDDPRAPPGSKPPPDFDWASSPSLSRSPSA